MSQRQSMDSIGCSNPKNPNLDHSSLWHKFVFIIILSKRFSRKQCMKTLKKKVPRQDQWITIFWRGQIIVVECLWMQFARLSKIFTNPLYQTFWKEGDSFAVQAAMSHNPRTGNNDNHDILHTKHSLRLSGMVPSIHIGRVPLLVTK